MRLIDADEMLKRLESWNTDDEMDKALYNFTLNRIIEQPTVDAVPIEVIERYREKLIWCRDMFQPHTMQWESVDDDICVVDEILKYNQKGTGNGTD